MMSTWMAQSTLAQHLWCSSAQPRAGWWALALVLASCCLRSGDETPPNGPDPDALEPEVVEPALEAERIRELRARKSQRDPEAIASLCRDLKEHLAAGRNAVEGFIRCAEGGVTLGEMSRVLVEVFGEHAE